MSSSPTARDVFQELQQVARTFNLLGIANKVFEPVLTQGSPETLVHSPNRVDARILENISYSDLYELADREFLYMFKLVDGALLQFDYAFDRHGRKLQRHRLAFLPSPHLDPFMDFEEAYWKDHSFVEIVGHQVSPVPIRLDFDARPGVAASVTHPAAHLTLGQYLNCRIPVSGPVHPSAFASFIGRHFYSDSSGSMGSFPRKKAYVFDDTLTGDERRNTFLQVSLD